MNRKQFITSQGATCNNWTWSWSFVNHEEKMVIFGAWDIEGDQRRDVILREKWETVYTNGKDRRQPGYNQALDHIKLIEQGYQLYTFDMVHSEREDNPNVSVIKGFTPELKKRYLRKEVETWYAYYDANPYPDELTTQDNYIEGAKKRITVNAYERDPRARQVCIQIHGTVCKGCGFDFEKVYGEHGRGFIHVHHIKPIHTLGAGYELDPVEHLIPLCPNCHAMVHRGSEVLSIDELKILMKNTKI
ncbi:HNH endonuclease [Serratia inhibens]|uniref:HNH endonuclease n=1 Tax=Serratia inhibens TaxID=2338073 RepID=UPI0005C5765C|nr:HNH endonuclease [Serratia inhibens]